MKGSKPVKKTWREYFKELKNEDTRLDEMYKNLPFSEYLKYLAATQAWERALELNEVNSENCPAIIGTKKLSEKVGINYETFRDYLYEDKILRDPRDYVIAICLVLCIKTDDVNQLLSRYKKQRPLIEEDPRDRVFISYFDNNKESYDDVDYDFEPISIDAVNKILTGKGLDPLSLGRAKVQPKATLNYRLDSVFTDIDWDLFGANQYNSLETEYDVFHAPVKAICRVNKLIDDNSYTVIYRPKWNYEKNDSLIIYDKNENRVNQIDDEEFAECISYLKKEAKLEAKRIRSVLDDTRNYGRRTSAKFVDGGLHVFSETFSFERPELEEYYFLDSCNGEYRFTVFDSSNFMSFQLGKIYDKRFGKKQNKIYSIYKSEKEIVKHQSADIREENETVIATRKRAYHLLKQAVDSCREEIRKRNIFVRDVDYIYSGELGYLCDYYGLSSEFECVVDVEEDGPGEFYHPNKEEAVINYDNCEINISLNELKRAFELGLNSTEEICKTIKEYGKINNII